MIAFLEQIDGGSPWKVFNFLNKSSSISFTFEKSS